MMHIAKGFRKSVLIVAMAALALAFVPMATASALAPSDPPTPVAPAILGGVRVELAWARQRFAHDRMVVFFGHADDRIAQIQSLIDRAKAHGRDVTAVQTSLDAFAAAVKGARPTFESMTGIVASHQGFDANGSVTDLAQAIQTVQTMRGKITQVRSAIAGPLQALRDAIRAARQANHPTATPAS